MNVKAHNKTNVSEIDDEAKNCHLMEAFRVQIALILL
jgi:hypothetical protein